MNGNLICEKPAQFAARVLCLFCIVLILISCLSCGGGQNSPSSSTFNLGNNAPINGTWTLTWSDEFNGIDGSPPDSTKWGFDTGGGGWGNNELETYTSRTQNAQILGGNLAITAIQEDYIGTDGIFRNYTSARITTQGKFSQQYGRFEARIKLPAGKGIWPAFWLLGDNITTVFWPSCGELDIMENIGNHPATVYSTIHGPNSSGAAYRIGATYKLPYGNFSDDFHVFAMEWEPGVLRFYVDGNLYAAYTPASLPKNFIWVFDHPFFIALNLAVGGDWAGAPDSSTVFPQTMLVDYVRVYAQQ